jgi:hypothetical protein
MGYGTARACRKFADPDFPSSNPEADASMSFDPDIAGIQSRIVEYLDRYPNAADTSKGIARWWLQEDHSARRLAIEEALDELVANGTLVTRRLPSGDLLYSARPRDRE